MKPIIYEVTNRAEDKFRTTITLSPTEEEPFSHVGDIVLRIHKFQPAEEGSSPRDFSKPYPRSEVWDDWQLGTKFELKAI
jgi:hypothetical protein